VATSGVADTDALERVRRRLRDEFEYYAPNCLRIVNAQGHEIPFVLKPPQVRLTRQLEAQRAAGEPQRATVLKARKVGFSTQTQGKIVQRTTQVAHHHARVVAQDMETAAALFSIGRFMWANLPEELKPTLAYERNTLREKLMHFGVASLQARRAGQMGLESSITIDTEKSPAGGRGLTIRSLHLSEVAFWERTGKMLALLNAVPDDADTLVIVESTAKGLNAFYDHWQQSEAGNGFIPCFTPWFEENGYRRAFFNDRERREFEASLGIEPADQVSRGQKEEPDLIELMRERFEEWREEGIHPLEELADEDTRILEALNWRRWAIGAKCEGSVEKFHQEYPSTAQEAFLSTGSSVFSKAHVRRSISRATKALKEHAPAQGTFVASARRTVALSGGRGALTVPTEATWVPMSKLNAAERGRAKWTLFVPPTEAGRYVVGVDPASGEDNDGQLAEHGIQVIDHLSLGQVAEWGSGLHDADEVGEQALLAALFFNRAWLVVEKTGGWGLSILRWLARDVKYPYTYRTMRKDVASPGHFDDSLGWSTDAATKPLMRDRGRQLLREGTDGIRSLALLGQMLTYIMDERGRMAPESKKLADLLMAWLIAQMVAMEKPPRREKGGGGSYQSNTSRSATWHARRVSDR
jgi:hypothetical protein